MKRTKVLLWVAVFAVAVFIVWRVGFRTSSDYLSGAEARAGGVPASQEQAGPNQPSDSNRPTDANRPARSDANMPSDANRPGPPSRSMRMSRMTGPGRPGMEGRPAGMEPPPGAVRPPDEAAAGSAKPADANAAGTQLEAVNLKDVEMKNVIEKIATWTGKTVIPHEEAMKQKITIYAPEKLPRKQALAKIYSALKMKGFVAEVEDDTIFIKPIAQAKQGVILTVEPNEPLAMFENKDQIVRKFFKLTNYSAAQMSEIVRPFVGEYGHVSADEASGSLMIIDTVASLISIERIVAQFDVPNAGKSVERFFEIKYGDPAEIIQVIRLLMGEPSGSGGRRTSVPGRSSSITISSSSPSSSSPSSPSPGGGGPSPGGPASRGGSQGSASMVVIGAGEIPTVLISLPKQKSIVARGSAENIAQIGEWIKKLDREEPVRSESETIPIRYANAREVATRINDTLANAPGAEGLRPSIVVQPLEQSRQVLVIGRKDLREMVKGLIAEIDMPVGTFETKVFPLKYADPDQIKANIESLYSENIPGSQYSSSAIYYYYQYGAGRNAGGADTVKVISFPTMKQVTVIASPENMRKIEKQIEEWDTPLNVKEVMPRIIELHNSDPVKMVEVLTKLFTEESQGFDIYEYIYGVSQQNKKKIVGPLYGQLTFQDVPGTKKIIVVSKIPAAYEVVEQLIMDLDRQEMGEIPSVVPLKYADAEDLAERLNAMFNVEGTAARIRRTSRGLSEDATSDSQSSGKQSTPVPGGNNNPNSSNANEYTPPWSAGGSRRSSDEAPISNVIGRVRFIPDPRTKSLLVLAPREFQDEIGKTIRELDIPGKQVMIKAIIVEVDHSSMTSLGVQLATNPNTFGTLSENAVTALGQLTNLATHGSAVATGTGSTSPPLGATGTGTIAGGTTAVYALIDFLIKHTNAKILNQQTLWTEDNEEAMFFKGQTVAFLGGATTSASVGVTQSVDYYDVGMRMRVRPSITPEKHVDMVVRILLSQLTPEFVNSEPIRNRIETSTNMIVQDGETVMLGGMLLQNDTRINRKLPLLGDLPLIGGLFQHNDVELANNELIVFVTPYVIEDVSAMSDKAKEQLDNAKGKLKGVQEDMKIQSQQLDEEVNKP